MRFGILFIALLLTTIIGSKTFAQQQIPQLIQALADPDPAKRRDAEAELSRLGRAARPALVEASRLDDPAIAPAAARVLLKLPWATPDDPMDVRQMLSLYGAKSEQERIGIVSQIAVRPAIDARRALLRLIVEEPSEDVCWRITSELRDVNDPALLEEIRKLDPPADRPAALMLVGHAWEPVDREKAKACFRKAVEAEARQPTLDNGELQHAYDLLAGEAMANSRYDEAAEVRRMEASRFSIRPAGYPAPVYNLFLLHGEVGPLQGLEGDVLTFSEYLGDPPVVRALERMYARAGRPLEAMIIGVAAQNAGLSSLTRLMAATTLSSAGWGDAARQEAYAALGSSPATGDGIALDDAMPLYQWINARRLLGMMATQDENSAAAIEHHTKLIELMRRTPGLMLRARAGAPVPLEQQYVELQIAWNKARIALDSGDAAAAKEHLDKIVDATPTESEIVLNTYPLLVKAGRREEAQKLFDAAYADAQQQLATDPTNPTYNNDLAWLCARCDQRLPEALEMSKRAVAARPYESAYIDTLAEVQFRMGNAAEAAKLEALALRLRPADEFMKRQFERFSQGVPR